MKTTKQLVKFDFDVAVITALDAKYKDIQITDTTSYAIVMAGLAEYRELRLAIDDKHKELKSDILEAGRGLDGDKNRLKGLLEPGEDYLKHIRLTWDEEKAAIKEEKDRKEKERIEAIQEKINGIRDLGVVNNLNAAHIEERLIIIQGMMLTQEVYQEFTNQAEDAHNSMIAALKKALTERLQTEKEDAERKAEAERLEAQRKEQEAAQAKIDEEKREIEENRKKFEETERKAKLKKEQEEWEKDEKARILLELEERKAEAEQKQIEKEEAEKEKRAHQERIRPDKEKLIGFAERLIDIEAPHVTSGKAITIIIEAQGKLSDLAKEIKEQAEKL